MIDGTAFGVGVLVGGLLGALIVGFWIAARVRARWQAQLLTTGERAQRAESLAEELRRQSLQDRVDLDQDQAGSFGGLPGPCGRGDQGGRGSASS